MDKPEIISRTLVTFLYYPGFFEKIDENRNSKYPTPFLGSEGRRFGKKLVHNFRSGFWESGIDVLLDGTHKKKCFGVLI